MGEALRKPGPDEADFKRPKKSWVGKDRESNKRINKRRKQEKARRGNPEDFDTQIADETLDKMKPMDMERVKRVAKEEPNRSDSSSKFEGVIDLRKFRDSKRELIQRERAEDQQGERPIDGGASKEQDKSQHESEEPMVSEESLRRSIEDRLEENPFVLGQEHAESGEWTPIVSRSVKEETPLTKSSHVEKFVFGDQKHPDRITEKRLEEPFGDVLGIEEYVYDSEGRLTTKITKNEDGNIESQTRLSYDDKGRLSREKVFNRNLDANGGAVDSLGETRLFHYVDEEADKISLIATYEGERIKEAESNDKRGYSLPDKMEKYYYPPSEMYNGNDPRNELPSSVVVQDMYGVELEQRHMEYDDQGNIVYETIQARQEPEDPDDPSTFETYERSFENQYRANKP